MLVNRHALIATATALALSNAVNVAAENDEPRSRAVTTTGTSKYRPHTGAKQLAKAAARAAKMEAA